MEFSVRKVLSSSSVVGSSLHTTSKRRWPRRRAGGMGLGGAPLGGEDGEHPILLQLLTAAAYMVVLVAAQVLVGLLVVKGILSTLRGRHTRTLLRDVPHVRGGLPLLGHALELARAAPWEVMCGWVRAYGPVVVWGFMGNTFILVADPEILKRVLVTNARNYSKDVGLSFKHFLPILGTGIVTSEGAEWRRQRAAVQHSLRSVALERVGAIAWRAAGRLLERLGRFEGTGLAADMAEEFRRLALQVMGEALLGISPDEADRNLSTAFLPLVAECNRRSYNPLRAWLPLPAAWRHRRLLRRLDEGIHCRGYDRCVFERRARWRRGG